MESRDAGRDLLIYRLLNMGSYSDRDGRPLLEGHVPPEQRRLGVPFELRPCPYAGARAAARPARPMNVSALKRILATLPETFGLFLYLREQYLARLPRRRMLFVDLWRVGVLITSLPRFLACRSADAVPDGELPPYIADGFKFAAGVSILMMMLAYREAVRAEGGILPAITVESLLKQADGMLVGDQEVCAAPPALIAEALSAFVAGTVSFKTVEPPIRTLIKNFDAYFAFASAYMDLKVALSLLTAMHQCLVNNLLAKVKNQERRDAHGRFAQAAVFQSLTAALSQTGSDSPLQLYGLPMLEGTRSAILKSSREKRCDLFHRLAKNLVSQSGEERTQLLGALERAAGILKESGAVNPIHLDAIRNRWPRVTKVAALRCAAAWGQCAAFEAAALQTLGALEANLRVPLSHLPMDAPLPAGVLSLVIGPSCTEALNVAFRSA